MEHYLQYIMEMTVEQEAIVKDSGDIELDPLQTVLDIYDAHLHCTACVQQGLDMFAYHGVSPEYDVF